VIIARSRSSSLLRTQIISVRLETALRSYSALTKNDIIEIEYNMIHFELLIMETNPEGSGISVIDTDLEVGLSEFQRLALLY